jgi:DNA-binding NtrC family response regulator
MTDPRTVDTHKDAVSSQRREPTVPQPYLFLVLECDRPAGGGARYSLAGVDEVVIGRGSERRGSRQAEGGKMRLLLRVPARSMSSSHARIRRGDEGWTLEDAGSTNGSFVNGYKVDRAVLGDGDVIELGHALFVMRYALPTPAPGATDLDSRELASEPPGFATLLPEGRTQLEMLARVAKSKLAILLLGDTGTGKEVIARSIHAMSGRPGPFVAINCGALPAELVEAQLFGHVKGSFSGAIRDEPGSIRTAEEGTILLDEVGDLPRAAQPALLRFLQESEVTPVGSARAVSVDVRVIAATHQPLGDFVSTNRFRADLLARLSGFVHALPSLRARREDLGLILASIAQKHGQGARSVALSVPAGRRLLAYEWPANIRELDLAIVRAFTLAEDERIEERHLQLGERASAPPRAVRSERGRADRRLTDADADLRRELVLQLEKHRGSVAEVARALGKARMQIHRWLKRFDIDPARYRK